MREGYRKRTCLSGTCILVLHCLAVPGSQSYFATAVYRIVLTGKPTLRFISTSARLPPAMSYRTRPGDTTLLAHPIKQHTSVYVVLLDILILVN
jgi:hypothetical protein